ncbi:hypothetical protein [Streptomyces sp. NPDC057580]|uniref:hypothetical protein n=1 Tax=Streptomyces sp. NPDC057580 TaxID=3346173 RepID=UPI0036773720
MPDTPTTRLGLYKSKSDGSELTNYTQDIGQNLDKLDLAAGFQPVTSTTRPSAPFSGKAIFETDTSYRSYFSNGTAPASGSWVEIPNSSGTFGSTLKLAAAAQLTIGADVNVYRQAANVLATDDDFAIAVVGKGLRVKEGTNAKMGTATLNGTTAVVVSTTAVTANSRIQLTIQTPNAGTAGSAYVSARTAGTSFSIKSTNAADVSTVAWMLVEPA